MAKLKKRNANQRTSPGSGRQNSSTLYIGLLLAVAVAVLVGVFITNIQEKGEVMVAKGNIPAFSTITAGQLEIQTVPKDSITPGDLTKEQFEKNSAGGKTLVNRIELLAGQRVPLGAVTESSTGSLAAVKPGERVVALNSTFSGSVAGVANAGSVVDVYPGPGASNENGAGVAVEDAKVLALGVGGEVAANVNPGGKVNKDEANKTSEGIVVVLVVPESDAPTLLALPQASLALDPKLSFTENGTICQISRCAQLNKAQQSGQATQPTDPQSGDTNTVDPATPDTPEVPAPTDGPAGQ